MRRAKQRPTEPRYFLIENLEVVHVTRGVIVRAWDADEARRSQGWANRAQTLLLHEDSDGDETDCTEFRTLEAALQEVAQRTGERPDPSVLVDAAPGGCSVGGRRVRPLRLIPKNFQVLRCDQLAKLYRKNFGSGPESCSGGARPIHRNLHVRLERAA